MNDNFSFGKKLILISYTVLVIDVYFRLFNPDKQEFNLNFIDSVFSASIVSIIFFFITDIIKNNVRNQVFWIIYILLIPLISAPIYLWRREGLIPFKYRKN